MKSKNSLSIIGFTTDPYDNIYGYTLVFFRFFNYLQENYSGEIKLFSNDGICSTLIKNKEFHSIKLNKNENVLKKVFLESKYFYEQAKNLKENSVIVVNCEIPELLVGLVMTIQGKLVFSILQDDRVRNSSPYTRFVCYLRIFLISHMKHVIFTNKYTQQKIKGNFTSHYLGNPIF